MYKDGAQAWEGKDFLIEQEGCKEVMIENRPYPGKFAQQVLDILTKKKKSVLNLGCK